MLSNAVPMVAKLASFLGLAELLYILMALPRITRSIGRSNLFNNCLLNGYNHSNPHYFTHILTLAFCFSSVTIPLCRIGKHLRQLVTGTLFSLI